MAVGSIFMPGCYFCIRAHNICQGVMQMTCAWDALLNILPIWLRPDVDRLGKERLQELRLRLDAPVELVLADRIVRLERKVSREDLKFCINTASRYSPWTAETIAKGYITASGGHRIGLCGEVACKDGNVVTIREVQSVNIRVCRDFPGIGDAVSLKESALILGAPGWGKTTLLRDIARRISKSDTVAVVDERGELFPEGIDRGQRMDVLIGCPKPVGIDMVLRTMGPEWIAVDEITAVTDLQALLQCVGCGVKLLATAHAADLNDFRNRPVYRPLLECRIFQSIVVLHKDKSFYIERLMV